MVTTVEQPKRTIVLGKDWFHVIKIGAHTREDSSIPGTKHKTLQEKYCPRLYDPRTHGKCCVGVYLSACGISNRQLSGKERADDLQNLPKEALWLVTNKDNLKKMSRDAGKLYDANDGTTELYRPKILQKTFLKRQREIIHRIFAKHNVEVVFEN